MKSHLELAHSLGQLELAVKEAWITLRDYEFEFTSQGTLRLDENLQSIHVIVNSLTNVHKIEEERNARKAQQDELYSLRRKVAKE